MYSISPIYSIDVVWASQIDTLYIECIIYPQLVCTSIHHVKRYNHHVKSDWVKYNFKIVECISCRHGPGLKLSQAKLPPSFQRVPPVSLCENERLTATRNLGPAPPIVQSPVYTGSSSVDESLMSEAEKQLQELLARQLDTSESSLAK